MAVYYFNLALITVLGFLLCVRKPTKPKKIIYLAVTFGFMWFLATFRSGIGFDYRAYIDIFNTVRAAGWAGAFTSLELEPGFVVVTKLIGICTDSTVVMYGIYAALIYVPVAWFIYRYVEDSDAWLAVWLYVTLAFFYGTMNFIRQNLACSIMLLGYRFLREKKPIPFVVFVLLGASVHKTALVMLPVYFFTHLPPGRKTGIFYASATVLLYITSVPILDFVTRFIFTSYNKSNPAGYFYIDPANGFPLYFLLVPGVIFGGCLALYASWKTRDKDAALLMNLMTFNFIIWIFITRHFILERFSLYVNIYALLAVPAALSVLRAPAEDYAKLAEMKAAVSTPGKKGRPKPKEEQARLKQLEQKISDHKKYYWSAVAAIWLLTLIYNEYGANVNHFHNVFPYRSIFPWFN